MFDFHQIFSEAVNIMRRHNW